MVYEVERLFGQKEALAFLGWLDEVDSELVSVETMEKLRKLVGLWTK